MTAPTVTETDPERSLEPPREIAAPAPRLPALDANAYEILGEVARGGMGRILRARDRRLGRIVAIKQLLEPTPKLAAMFEREVRITARLQHPSIVSVHEAGVLPSGELVYVMKLVTGRPLRDVLREAGDVRARLALLPAVIAIADALAYAHGQHVIHRDLKPSNVLVGEFGEVVVIDWGLARTAGDAVEAAIGEPTAADVTASVMGTPAYMAPEAARGEAVDARADVYAIGAILYEVLAGESPYRGDAGAEIVEAVRTGPPVRITVRAPGTPADLAAIVDKAMARDRERRYPSARELAEELRRFATGQLVSAHAYSLRERVRRFARKHRAPLIVAAAAAALVVTLVAFGVRRIVHERDVADDRADRTTLAQARLELETSPRAALETLRGLPAGSPLWSAARAIAADAFARGVPRQLDIRPVAALALAGDRARTLVRHDDSIEVFDDTRPIARFPGEALAAALSDDGGSVAALGRDGHLRVWRVDGGRVVREIGGGKALARVSPVIALAADGSAVALAGDDAGIRVWSLPDGDVRSSDHKGVDQLAVAGTIVAASGAGQVTFIDGPPIARAARAIAISRDGRMLALAAADGVHVVTVATRADVAIPGIAASALALSPDGSLVAAVDERGVQIWTTSARHVRTLLASHHAVRGVAIADGGRTVALAEDQRVLAWTQLGADRNRARGGDTPVTTLATRDGVAITGDESGAIWAWSPTPHRLGAHLAAVRAIAIASDGAIVSTGDDRTVRRWRANGSELVGVHLGSGLAIAVSPDGTTVASGGDDRSVRLWRGTAAIALEPPHAGAVRVLAFAADGRLASIADDHEARIWPAGGGEPQRLAHDAQVTAIAWLGRALVTGTRAGDVTLWSEGEPQLLARHDGAVRALAVSADGRIASAGDDGEVGIGDATGLVLRRGHDDLVRGVAFSPDGATLASAGEDGTVRIWDVLTGERRSLAIAGWVAGVAFTPDGDAVLAAASDGALWTIRDDLPRAVPALRDAIAARLGAPR